MQDTNTRAASKAATLRTIRARLERWELQHLRDHCAQLAQRVEDLELDVTRESGAADHWRNQCQALIEDLQDARQEGGMTVDGQLGAICGAESLVASALVQKAIDFIEGFRDDPDQEGVVDLLDGLAALHRRLQGGAA